MAYFAKLGIGNVVERVESVADNVATTEQAAIDFLRELYKDIHSQWAQTYVDGSIRKNYAGIGDTYDQTRDAFIAPKPFASWILNETTCRWETPVAYPDDGQRYSWNEETKQWDLENE